jgi:hypothetical protein
MLFSEIIIVTDLHPPAMFGRLVSWRVAPIVAPVNATPRANVKTVIETV